MTEILCTRVEIKRGTKQTNQSLPPLSASNGHVGDLRRLPDMSTGSHMPQPHAQGDLYYSEINRYAFESTDVEIGKDGFLRSIVFIP